MTAYSSWNTDVKVIISSEFKLHLQTANQHVFDQISGRETERRDPGSVVPLLSPGLVCGV